MIVRYIVLGLSIGMEIQNASQIRALGDEARREFLYRPNQWRAELAGWPSTRLRLQMPNALQKIGARRIKATHIA